MASWLDETDPNKSVIEYLHYYCDPDSNFDYAVMLKGKWGSGKTHLINEFLKQREEKNLAKNQYVSLYGLTSFRQIEQELYRQLHPVLSSKGMKLAAAVTKGLLKATTKIDLNSDGKDDVTINSSVPELDLMEYFRTPKECLLVFDDLERCSMKVSDVLGYINSFVEHEEFKAIIIANEDEILRRDAPKSGADVQNKKGQEQNEETQRYNQIKEKLIGQTLKVRSTLMVALPHFLTLIRSEKTKAYLKEHLEDIRIIHSQSDTDNLRLLKQALWDFERFSACLTEVHWANLEAIGIIFRVLLSLSFEARSGRLSQQQLVELPNRSRIALFGRKEGTLPTPADELRKRYPEVKFDQALLTADLLSSLLFDGWVEANSIRKALDESPYYADPGSVPAWRVAWSWWDLSDEECEQAAATLEQEFAERAFTTHDVLFHVFGLRICFSKIGVIKKTTTEVVEEAKTYIDDLRKRGVFPDPLQDYRPTGSHGLGVQEADTTEFKSILDYYKDVESDVLRKSLPTEGKKLLAIMNEDVQQFFNHLCPNNVTASPLYNKPVLASIEPRVFVDDVLALPSSAQGAVFNTLKARYDSGMLKRELSEEKPWLDDIKNEFEGRLSSLNALSKFRTTQRIAMIVSILSA